MLPANHRHSRRISVKGAAARLIAAVAFLLLIFEAWVMPPAFAEEGGSFKVLLTKSTHAHFVATDGNDNGPGTVDQPWATINHAAKEAEAGETVVVRGGHYVLPAQIRPVHSGQKDAWITFIGHPGEQVVLDADKLLHSDIAKEGLDNGAFQIENVAYVRVINLTIVNSHDAGFTIRDSSHVDLINNTTRATFSSGIAVWNTHHDDKTARYVRILGNIITRATTWDLAPPDMERRGEPPHEAMSLGGASNFEVAYNDIYNSDKEGIDIKETSRHGEVHNNLVHDIARQCLYVDSWFGALHDVKIYANVLHDCRGAGLALSAENGPSVSNIDIRNNLIFNNKGSGLYFSRWGANSERRDIRIVNNTFYHNGFGAPADGQSYYWMTGGLYLYSAALRHITIKRNIFSDNCAFQVGYSDLYTEGSRTWPTAAREKNIKIADNLIDGHNASDSPIESGGAPRDQVKIYAASGEGAIFGDSVFKDAADQNFMSRQGITAHAALGANLVGSSLDNWWKHDAPPKLF